MKFRCVAIEKRNSVLLLFLRLTFVIPILLLFSCNSAKMIQGSYSTKFASNGFFRTFLDLAPDSSFFYQFSGDLENRMGVGSYVVENRTIKLHYAASKYDTLISGVRDDTVWTADRKFLRIEAMGIAIKTYDTALVESRPKQFYYRCGKLYGIDSTGKIYNRKGFVYSPRRKYFLFGTHYFNRKNPLRKYRHKDIA